MKMPWLFNESICSRGCWMVKYGSRGGYAYLCSSKSRAGRNHETPCCFLDFWMFPSILELEQQIMSTYLHVEISQVQDPLVRQKAAKGQA